MVHPNNCTDQELVDLFEAFDVRWDYDHEDKSVAISLALMQELTGWLESLDRETNTTGAMAGRGNRFIAGAS